LTLGLGLWGQAALPGHDLRPPLCSDADQARAGERWEAARRDYEACLRTGPARFEVWADLGLVNSHLGRTADAIQAYRQALQLSHGDARVRTNLALVLLQAEDYAQAVAELDPMLQADPVNLRAEELLAFARYHLGEYRRAAHAAERVHRAHPDDAANALVLGSAYTRLGRYREALPLLTFALRAAGSAEGHLIMGETFLGLRLYRSALREFTAAQAAQPGLPGLATDLGLAKVGAGNPAGAMDDFTRALREDPNAFQAAYYLARLNRLAGHRRLAQQYLARAAQLRPGDAGVAIEYAVLALDDNDSARAAQLLEGVVRQQPALPEAHFLLSRIYLKAHRWQAAKREQVIFEKLGKKSALQATPSERASRPALPPPAPHHP